MSNLEFKRSTKITLFFIAISLFSLLFIDFSSYHFDGGIFFTSKLLYILYFVLSSLSLLLMFILFKLFKNKE